MNPSEQLSNSGHTASVTIFCNCGWLMELFGTGVGMCKNPRCPQRGTLYQVTVRLDEVPQDAINVA